MSDESYAKEGAVPPVMAGYEKPPVINTPLASSKEKSAEDKDIENFARFIKKNSSWVIPTATFAILGAGYLMGWSNSTTAAYNQGYESAREVYEMSEQDMEGTTFSDSYRNLFGAFDVFDEWQESNSLESILEIKANHEPEAKVFHNISGESTYWGVSEAGLEALGIDENNQRIENLTLYLTDLNDVENPHIYNGEDVLIPGWITAEFLDNNDFGSLEDFYWAGSSVEPSQRETLHYWADQDGTYHQLRTETGVEVTPQDFIDEFGLEQSVDTSVEDELSGYRYYQYQSAMACLENPNMSQELREIAESDVKSYFENEDHLKVEYVHTENNAQNGYNPANDMIFSSYSQYH